MDKKYNITKVIKVVGWKGSEILEWYLKDWKKKRKNLE